MMTSSDKACTILRIKRKRNEEPLDALVFDPQARKKKSRGGLDVFQFAQTVEADAFEDEERRRDLEEQINKLAKEDAIKAALQPTTAHPISRPASPLTKPKEEPNRRYQIVNEEAPDDVRKRKGVNGPPRVLCAEEVSVPKAPSVEVCDAVSEPVTPPPMESTSDLEMEKFLPLLNDYLKLHDVVLPPSPPVTPPGKSGASKKDITRVDATKVDAAKGAHTKVDTSKVAAPEVVARTLDTITVGDTKGLAIKVDATRVDASKVIANKADATRANAPKVDDIDAGKVDAATDTGKVDASKGIISKSDTRLPKSMSAKDYVWDVFYRRPATLSEWNDTALSNIATLTGLPSTDPDMYDSRSESEEEDGADEDSNAEEYYKNDYPDEYSDNSDMDADEGSDIFHETSEHEDLYNDSEFESPWRSINLYP